MPPKPIKYFICALGFCLLMFQNAYSQLKNLQPENLQLHFLSDSLQIESNNFAFNSCNIFYNGNVPLHVTAQITTPADVQLLTASFSDFSLQNNQQYSIPLRFIAQSELGTEWKKVDLVITVKETRQQIIKSFWVRLKQEQSCKGGLMQQELFVSKTDATATMSFWIENTGNIADVYKISFAADDFTGQLPDPRKISMQAGEKKIVQVPVNIQQAGKKPEGFTLVNVNISNTAGNKKMYLQKITFIGNTFSQHHYSWKKMPLSVELSAHAGYKSKSIFSAAVSGTLLLENKASLSVDSRFINVLQPTPTHRHITVQYKTPQHIFTAGRITGFDHFLLNGNGFSVINETSKRISEVVAVKNIVSSGRYLKVRNSMNLSHKFHYSTENFLNDDKTSKVFSLLSVNRIKWQLSDRTKVSFAGGGSLEKVTAWKNLQKLYGFMYGYDFETTVKQNQVTSKMELYSRSFAGYNKGYTYHNHEVKRQMGNIYLSAYYVANKKVYTNNLDSLFTNLFNVNNSEVGAKTGISNNKLSLTLVSGMSRQKQDSTNSFVLKTWKSTANIVWKITPEYIFSLCSNVGLSQIENTSPSKKFFGINNYGSLQRSGKGIYFQISSGPSYYFEAKDFYQTGIKQGRMQLAPFYEQTFSKLNSFLRLQLLWNKEQNTDLNSVAFNNQITFSPHAVQTELSMNSSLNFTRKEASYIYLSVRKSLHVPIVKNRASNNFSILLFRDKNNNNIYDEKVDEVIPDANILVDQQVIQSDEKGMVAFENIGSNAVAINLSNINNRGWLPKLGLMQRIVPHKKITRVFIPFTQSRTVSGSLVGITDDKSSEVLNLAYIRITATDEAGNTFSTLTDAAGSFNLNLPAAQYIISLNPSAFGDKFIPRELSQAADLINNEHLKLSFEIRQKKRQINIQRSGN